MPSVRQKQKETFPLYLMELQFICSNICTKLELALLLNSIAINAPKTSMNVCVVYV